MGDVAPPDELVEEPSDFGSLRPGTRLGRYELLVPIARGGMARVWAARLHGQRGFQKLVAIKTILPQLANEREFERMFLDEARIASGVHHPNVCEIYELGDEDSTLYLAMEWVSGDSFARVLRASGKTEAIDPRVVARVVADACAGLHAAHELTDDVGRPLGVVHRDLSPHNILLTADGVAKVADFGVAKALGQLHEVTSAGQLKGKIHYMSPEQVTGAPVDRRSDVFSLGCLLYEATTGARPFPGEGDHQVMHHLLKGEFTPPSQIARGYPQELERIVQRAMSPLPMLRFPSAERMRFALEEFLARGPLVTQSNVAQVMRERVGEHLERRKERIRQASTTTDLDVGWSEPPGASLTPSGQAVGADARSGVKQTSQRPLFPSPGGPPAPAGPLAPDGPPAPADAYGPTLMQTSPVIGVAGQFGPPLASLHAPQALAIAPVWAQAPGMPRIGDPMDHRLTMSQPLSMPMAPGPVGWPYGRYAPAPSEPPASAAQYAGAVALGVLVAAVIAGGGLFAWRAKHKPATPLAEPISAPSPTAAPVMAPTGAPIVFQTEPPDATITIDGAPLAPDVRQIPRPAAGRSITVFVRAPGREEATLFVDYFTKAPVAVRLKVAGGTAPPQVALELGAEPTEPPPAAPPAEGTPAADPARARSAQARPKQARPTTDDALPAVPDNPY